MDFNPLKTDLMIFSNKRIKSKPNILMKNISINQAPEHKHLGIILSSDMKWTSHIDYIIRKSRKKLGLLRRQSQNLTTKQKIDIYKTMIRPILEYGSIIFDNSKRQLKIGKLSTHRCHNMFWRNETNGNKSSTRALRMGHLSQQT